MSSRLSSLISPEDEPELVRVKIKDLSNELATSGKHDRHTLAEATEFLQDKWQDLKQSISRAGKRMRSALDSAWKKSTHQ